VLGIFYAILFFILFLRFLRRAYLYTRNAQVAITDGHYITGGYVFEKDDTDTIRSRLKTVENIFDESLLGESRLAERKQHAQKALMENLKDMAL